MNKGATLKRWVLVSPWPLAIFLLIPLLAVLKVAWHLPLPLPGVKTPLLVNNISFAVVVALRLGYYLLRLPSGIRYGAAGVPGYTLDAEGAPDKVRERLKAGGFRFSADGSYGERPDGGYWGTVLVYGGLLLTLATGAFDNLYQFSGTLLDGQGRATDLNKAESYRDLLTGPLSGTPSQLPQLKILRQINPNQSYPRGATEVAFLFPDGAAKKTILKCPDPFPLGAFDIYMSKMVYEPKLLVTIDKVNQVFSGSVLLDPLVTPERGYSFYGAFVNNNLDGEVFYQPEKSRLRFILRQGTLLLVDKELVFQGDRMQSSGNIDFVVERMGVWSEMHVVHRRHIALLVAGAVLALVGVILRLVFGRQRVWLENVYGNCRVGAVGAAAKEILEKA